MQARRFVTGRLLAAAAVVCVVAVAPAAAQQQPQAAQHAGEYSPADIQAGSVVYSLQCSQCHGPTGDQVGGIDLRSGRFRNNVSNDDDLRRIITNGIPNTSMPGRKLAPAELTSVVAYIRNMRDFNTTVVKLGDTAGPHPVRGQRLRRLPSRWHDRIANRVRPDRDRQLPEPGRHPAGTAGSEQHDDAHQPAGAGSSPRKGVRSTAAG